MNTPTIPWTRPPAVPLITHDPYFSIWSMDDQLTGGPTRHWTSAVQPLIGVAIVDGKPLRFMGGDWRQESLPALEQQAVEVWPLRTIYRFNGAGIELTLRFITPTIPADLDLLSRPVTYIDWAFRSADGQEHEVKVFFAISTVAAAEDWRADVTWARYRLGELNVLSASTAQQRMLERSGDNLRIEWGSLYLAVRRKGKRLMAGFLAARLPQHAEAWPPPHRG